MKVAIIKYNAGNIYSVYCACRRLGHDAVITDDPVVIRQADRVIFPGVGEARAAMQHLNQTGLADVIRGLQQPVLGICIGMQLLCSHSEEGDVDCLGIFDVPVVRFRPSSKEFKVPQMGWNTIEKFEKRIPVARSNFEKYDKDKKITLLEGDAADILAKLSDSYLGSITSVALSAKHSRYHETQADDYGYDFLKECGKNPWAMGLAFKKLKALSNQSASSKYSKLLEAFSSHPNFDERIERMKSRAIDDGYIVDDEE